MARQILIRRDGEENAFSFVKVDREKLYGKKRRVVVDELERECQAGWLSTDGTALVMAGGTAHVWVDEAWAAAEQDERVAVDEAGNVLELCASTLGVPQDAQVVSERRVLDHVIAVVYQLTPESLGKRLEAELAEGKIVELPFRYRDGLEPDTMFVLRNDEGIFALVGRESGFDFLERTILPDSLEPSADDEDELLGDLDFTML